jgi:hypothetical protein
MATLYGLDGVADITSAPRTPMRRRAQCLHHVWQLRPLRQCRPGVDHGLGGDDTLFGGTGDGWTQIMEAMLGEDEGNDRVLGGPRLTGRKVSVR